MSPRLIDLRGMKFGRWTVIGLHPKRMRYGRDRHSVQVLWCCVCDCGSERLVFGSSLRRGLTKSCGCLSREIGGRKLIDLRGMKFGRWTVIGLHPKRMRVGSEGHSVQALWRCVCDCGSERIVLGSNLRQGLTNSCGCWNREKSLKRSTKHGHAKRKRPTKVYTCWAGMRQRCDDPNHKSYPDYGGRGIRVCDEWLDFKHFLDDMGEPPRGKSLDRIDVDGNYEPANCRWATALEQARNKRNSWGTSDDYGENFAHDNGDGGAP